MKLFRRFKKDKNEADKKQQRLELKISKPILIDTPQNCTSLNDAYLLRTKQQRLFLHQLPTEILTHILLLVPGDGLRPVCRRFDDMLGPNTWAHLELDLAKSLGQYERETTVSRALYVPEFTNTIEGKIGINSRTDFQDFATAVLRGLDKLSGTRILTVTLPVSSLRLSDYQDASPQTLPVHIIERVGNDAFVNWMICWILNTVIPERCVKLERLNVVRNCESLDSYEPVQKLLSMGKFEKTVSLGPGSILNHKISNLKSLRLTQSDFKGLQRLPQLENLELVFSPHSRVPFEEMRSFLDRFPRLSSVQLYGIMVVYDKNDATKCWLPDTVRTLEVGGVEPVNNQLIAFNRVTTLRILDNVAGRSLLHHMVFPSLKRISFADQLTKRVDATIPGTEYPDTLPDFDSRYGLSIPMHFFPEGLQEVQTQFGSLSSLLRLVKNLPKSVQRLVLIDAQFDGNDNDEADIAQYLPNLRHAVLCASKYPTHPRTLRIMQSLCKCPLESFYLYLGTRIDVGWLTPTRFKVLTSNTHNTATILSGYKVNISQIPRSQHKRWRSYF